MFKQIYFCLAKHLEWKSFSIEWKIRKINKFVLNNTFIAQFHVIFMYFVIIEKLKLNNRFYLNESQIMSKKMLICW